MEVYLGEFVNQSGKFVVSDPCYDEGTWCMGRLEDIKTGTWKSHVVKSDEGIWGVRCAELIATHISVKNIDRLDWELCDFIVGVDSGQAGIFDLEYYNHDYGDTKFYNFSSLLHLFCCELTLSDESAGNLKYGTVSASGLGDGSYDCFAARNSDGKIIAVKIVFIKEDED